MQIHIITLNLETDMKFKKEISAIQILMHLTVWVGLIALLNSPLLGLNWGPYAQSNGTLLIPLIYGMAINAFLFYINAFKMVPQYLHGKKYKAFWIYSLLLLITASIIELGIDFMYVAGNMDIHNTEIKGTSMEKIEQDELLLDIGVWIASIFSFNLFFWAGAFLYRLPKDWMRNERAQQQLAQDKLRAELEFLKAQINPHFLFNGINSIYHLIGGDDEKAKNVLLQFSDLLRYQLYECKEEFIPLQKELTYVNNYILLEEVRKGEDAVISKELANLNSFSDESNLKIAPLILTPFLENAFKYLSLFSERESNQLSIRISVSDEILFLDVENTIDPFAESRKNTASSGIGLKNVKRRLSLLYPNKHNLTITNKEDIFKVNLKIHLS